jgi:hypothetical protein
MTAGQASQDSTSYPARQTEKFLPRLFLFAFLVSLIVVIQYSHLQLIAKLPKKNTVDETNLPSPFTAKLSSLGYEQLAADCYWLAFVQYLGDYKQRKVDHYRYCFDYLNLVTSLDPHFIQAYWFAAFAVGADQKRPDLSAKIIERGIAENQDNWYVPWIAGVNQYLYAHNEKLAAKYYRMAAKFPNAPDWLNRQASILESNIPSLVKEMRTWYLILARSNDYRAKDAARNNLIRLWDIIYRNTQNKRIHEQAKARIQALTELNLSSGK